MSDDPESLGVSSDGVEYLQKGVDYAWARPSPGGLRGEGYTFAARYFSWLPNGKVLSGGELSALANAGLDVVTVWEFDTGDALDGYNGGVRDANEALRQANGLGIPAGRPIYFAVDFDARADQQGVINSYFDGAAAVLGRGRIGAYGGYYVIKRLFDAGKIAFGWQTYAWSGGQWDARAQLRQVQNGITAAGNPNCCDLNYAVANDFGQWHGSGGGTPQPPTGGGDCAVRGDGKLYCNNTPGAAIRSGMSASSSVVNHLRTGYSWFDCWGTGERHNGGNTTWYHTLGDDNGNWGWVPGVNLSTPDSFDANPSAHGLRQCGGPPPPSSDCSVRGDGKLYCKNTQGAAMRASLNYSSSVVNHLRTGYSWFDCWGTGERHNGGNTTWYHTLGDDNGNWGWVPGVDLSTPDSFDANPSAHGLRQCGGQSADCSVHGDGKLYCTNTSGAAMHASTNYGSSVVNRLRTGYSWFDCWGTGERHNGGNTTWYHTQGDDNANWGWVPGVDLNTPDSFDADPSARGLRRCN
ncbi:DUF1906 domain-containing protein [Pendulispora albinea]|uniref:DUF1906 domain-containing protein n=1 Tax=Pendulispora albinea TaxID=2741071 RepID=A0ABZ2M571_9BACT